MFMPDHIDAADSQAAIHSLTEETLVEGLRFLAECDPDLALLLAELGPPPMWARKPGFATLVHIILEQQVSLASAKATFDRLIRQAEWLTPLSFLEFKDERLREIGFSRQKAVYVRSLASAIIGGKLDLDALPTLDDTAVRAALVQIKGIGNWTADIYLLMALRRPDIWPKGDLALAIAVSKVKALPARPTPDQLEALSYPWQPWRAVAARLLWHFYLSR